MNKEQKIKKLNISLRKSRTRKQIVNKKLPRLSVYRSLKTIYAQIIDDAKGITICSLNGKQVKSDGKKPVEVAGLVGEEIATKAIEKGVKAVVFDRGSYKYHGAVKALAEGARKQGLKL